MIAHFAAHINSIQDFGSVEMKIEKELLLLDLLTFNQIKWPNGQTSESVGAEEHLSWVFFL